MIPTVLKPTTKVGQAQMKSCPTKHGRATLSRSESVTAQPSGSDSFDPFSKSRNSTQDWSLQAPVRIIVAVWRNAICTRRQTCHRTDDERRGLVGLSVLRPQNASGSRSVISLGKIARGAGEESAECTVGYLLFFPESKVTSARALIRVSIFGLQENWCSGKEWVVTKCTHGGARPV
jgi:hypothetical protein